MNEITHQAVDLYFGILDFANRAGWASPLCIPNSKLITHCDFSDASQLSKIRNQLVQAGLIEYAAGRKGQAGKYYIKELNRCQINNNSDNNYDNNPGRNPDNNSDSNHAGIPETYINKNENKTKHKHHTPLKSPRGETVDEQLRAVEDEPLRAALTEFVKMRKQVKKPLTAHAFELCVKKLCAMSADIAERTLIVEQSVMNSWLSFYPLQDNKSSGFSAGIADDMLPTPHNEVKRIETAFMADYGS